jgi:hypothetical protein
MDLFAGWAQPKITNINNDQVLLSAAWIYTWCIWYIYKTSWDTMCHCIDTYIVIYLYIAIESVLTYTLNARQKGTISIIRDMTGMVLVELHDQNAGMCCMDKQCWVQPAVVPRILAVSPKQHADQSDQQLNKEILH